MYKNLYIKEDIMNELNKDNLPYTSTDMNVNMIANTEKIFDSNKRWNYGDKYDDADLDVEPDDYNKKDNLFRKQDSDKHHSDKHHSDKHYSDKHQSDKHHSDKDDSHSDSERGNGDTEKDTKDTSKLSKKELILLKLDMLRKLGELKQCGVHLSQNYNLDSDLDMMQYEYKLHSDIRSKQNSVQWMSHMLIGIVKGTEMLNDNYNPFDIKLGGLSDKISSDMHTYYTVLGDIYEKYNQPGKQMAPEMRLLLMISGAALSMQVNRAIPGLGGMANAVRDENNLKELRQKAEEDSNKTGEFYKKQHDAAAQKAADLKMLEERELEYQRMNKILDDKNSGMKKIKEQLILSSESPSKDTTKISKHPSNHPSNHPSKHSSKHPEEDTDSESEDRSDIRKKKNNKYISEEELENIRKMKFMEEQKHIENMRRIAHQKSEMFRKNNMNNTNAEEKRKQDLMKQDLQLDNILESLPKQTKKVSKPTRSAKDTESSSSSKLSSASTISINPNAASIMKKTSQKARKEMSVKSDSESATMKFDKNIQKLLDKHDSDLDNFSKEDISVGSSKSNKSSKENKKDKKKDKKTTSDIIDFNNISIGSFNKGTKPSMNIGRTS